MLATSTPAPARRIDGSPSPSRWSSRTLLGATGLILGLSLLAAPLLVEGGATTLSTRRIASGINRPVLAVAPPGDYTRLFIVEQPGVIRIYDMVNAVMLPTPFLNIASIVGGGDSGSDERGLLGLAFSPDFATNGHFFVSYTNNSSNTVIARYTVSTANPNLANASSALTILTQSQPETNHNGGMIAFSPIDGYLYIGLGDGGGGNDQHGSIGNGQLQTTFLGKMLRIDVANSAPGTPYVVPPTNPFVGPGGYLDEIWASGLRNPWRWSFDRVTGDMYIADVGQNAWEEVDFQPATSAGGENYGWRCMEGNSCTGLSGCTCNAPTLTDPIHVYSHSSGCSISGGYCYRGCAMPNMHGIYFFSDFCTSPMWSFRVVGGAVTEFTTRTTELDPPGAQSIAGVTSFGEDAYGEIYICDWNGGEIFKIVPADIATSGLDCDGNFILDTCEIAVGAVTDCNGNGTSDVCDISSGAATDCNGNDIPDSCEIAAFDCNANGLHDSCEIDGGSVADCNNDDIPDSCQIAGADCNGNGTLDSCDIAAGGSIDCDLDGTPDECEIAAGTEENCNGNALLDSCEIDLGLVLDCDQDGRIDTCQIDEGSAPDCNANGAIDSCDIAGATSPDSNQNGIPDECEFTAFRRSDCNQDALFDLADPVASLAILFAGAGIPTCEDACDSNDDGGFDISDPVHTLTRLFSAGPNPPSPYPGCGIDLTSDLLECDTFAGCP